MGQGKKTERKTEENRDWGLLLLVLGLFLFVGTLFVEGERDSRDAASRAADVFSGEKMGQRAVSQKINRDLKEAVLKDEIQQGTVSVENQAAPPINTADPSLYEETSSINPLLFDQENPGQKILKETDKAHRPSGATLTPDQRISSKLARDEWIKDYERRQKEEYVRQFLQNAKNHGINVRLNKNLDVTGLDVSPSDEPIRVPQSAPSSSK